MFESRILNSARISKTNNKVKKTAWIEDWSEQEMKDFISKCEIIK